MRGTVGITGAVVAGGPGRIAVHESVKVQANLIQPATSVTPPVRFQAGHPNFGADTPATLKRATTSGFQPTVHTQTNVTLQHQQGGPANLQHQQQGTGIQQQGTGMQHQQTNMPQGTTGGQPNTLQHQQTNVPNGQPNLQHQQTNTQPTNTQPSIQHQQGTQGQPVIQHQQTNTGTIPEHHENVEHHEEHRPPTQQAPVVNRPPVQQAPVVNKPPQQQQSAGKKCEKVNGKEVCR
jgi:hypothetical protein